MTLRAFKPNGERKLPEDYLASARDSYNKFIQLLSKGQFIRDQSINDCNDFILYLAMSCLKSDFDVCRAIHEDPLQDIESTKKEELELVDKFFNYLQDSNSTSATHLRSDFVSAMGIYLDHICSEKDSRCNSPENNFYKIIGLKK